ncbi:MAG: hypothetical protein WA900_04625 [Casimicrobiaceae bacterium]
MRLLSYLAVGVGAAVGALLRWRLGIALDPVFRTLPPGTLTANLCGGLRMGAAVGVADLLGHTLYGWNLLTIGTHVLGSLLPTTLGPWLA